MVSNGKRESSEENDSLVSLWVVVFSVYLLHRNPTKKKGMERLATENENPIEPLQQLE